MKETPQRHWYSAASTQSKIFILSVVVAGCAIPALLGRHVAIHRFGADEFSGNVLFGVFFLLSIGLCFGALPKIKSLTGRFISAYRKKERISATEGAIAVTEQQSPMEFSLNEDPDALRSDNSPEATRTKPQKRANM